MKPIEPNNKYYNKEDLLSAVGCWPCANCTTSASRIQGYLRLLKVTSQILLMVEVCFFQEWMAIHNTAIWIYDNVQDHLGGLLGGLLDGCDQPSIRMMTYPTRPC